MTFNLVPLKGGMQKSRVVISGDQIHGLPETMNRANEFHPNANYIWFRKIARADLN